LSHSRSKTYLTQISIYEYNEIKISLTSIFQSISLLDNILTWLTLSNALLMPIEQIITVEPLRVKLSMRVQIQKTACLQPFFFLKPNCVDVVYSLRMAPSILAM